MAPEFESTRTTPVLMLILPVVALAYLGACFGVNAYLPHENRNYVKWTELNEAFKESQRTNKPILYDFSAAWCGPCNQMESQVFGDKKSAQQINNMLIPVHVIDRRNEDGQNSLEVEKLQNKYKIDAFPTLIVMKPGEIDFKTQRGYGGAKATNAFLSKSALALMVADYSMEVAWKKLDDVIEQKDAQKPLLILFWDERGRLSRMEYLGSSKLIQTIKRNFIPVEVRMPVNAAAFKNAKSKALMSTLSVRHAPALVIVPQDDSMPHFNIGESGPAANEEFLEKYLQLRNPALQQH